MLNPSARRELKTILLEWCADETLYAELERRYRYEFVPQQAHCTGHTAVLTRFL